jgi:hypothetical protein
LDRVFALGQQAACPPLAAIETAPSMMIFLNEERAYQHWVTHHRLGYVLDGRRKPRISRLTVHRADCDDVRVSARSRRHATTGNRLKACSMDRMELETWAVETSGLAADSCPKCRPASERPAEAVHLTRLARDVLDYVLDAAVIHLEHEHPPYHLTIGDIAACFAKTPGQLGPVLQSLVEQGMVVCPGTTAIGAGSPKRVVLPTIAALRTLEAFHQLDEASLEAELAKLSE